MVDSYPLGALTLSFLGGADQGQPPACFSLGTLTELQSNLRWLLFVLGLEMPRQSYTMKLIWLLLVLGLGPTEASYFLFDRI